MDDDETPKEKPDEPTMRPVENLFFKKRPDTMLA
jgi:hypothetical protein